MDRNLELIETALSLAKVRLLHSIISIDETKFQRDSREFRNACRALSEIEGSDARELEESFLDLAAQRLLKMA